ncbi:cell division ATP-binding protein FtsE [Psychromonas ingrahamii 37]|uniref:Cell division ATP-binding protein FtsE n=1 Tax=Psychromonas ingrahamii (strain DSM 17664 / CCUG 51855 / 37) TaxID=357804 RepID=A1SSL2_PSYIN|nr:cell division ATP-binding protein FtsE [Psychromonas ingrahamii]ABM02477.1 cell division ATP-binding protein FtsE [Psychromonas ingrahamii 37]
MILFEDVSKVYPQDYIALNQVDFHLKQGEMAFLTGHSGSGKSTLLRLISLMERPTTGRIILDGNDISHIKGNDIPYLRRHIGMIFQEHRLLMNRTVLDNVGLPLLIEGYSRYEIKRRSLAALDKVGLSGKEESFPIHLSGGEQQRVGIARAIINQPPLLLADEPTGNLDPKLSLEILDLFKSLNEYGMSVLIATHDLGLIAKMRYRTLTLKEGEMINDGLLR